ncbi:rho guanine nucleotide exchange factor 16 [Alosa sapidissima]|uniref:rho guanine nucleotide exchange factor 16 n=1 Tax=Alosa sapidissima TaxID=34773 RepID=UPI001C091545|nr:rho guanine nucleotide exchange factor 16 [Alosa sapidissima]XP_041953125.1 rho guanine nucleotide exchange factor 16 [Alosa sapidissima]XP_041953126.1 rho guanine nucleotide exchange factor 16 [Alosa sapidissima]
MSNRLSDGSTGDTAPLLLEQRFRSDLQLNTHTHTPDTDTHTPDTDTQTEAGTQVVLSTQSKVAQRLGSAQLIPKSLAQSSRPKMRHHTTVVTLPVGALDTHKAKCVSHMPDLSWEDYDSDGDGFALRRNRRNKSYRAAVTSLSADAMAMERREASTLRPVGEERAPSPQPTTHRPVRKRTFGRKRNQKHGGSFKDQPRLYQEIKERGLQNTDEDFTQTEPPPEDQGIVVKNYRPAHMTWSQLPQVKDTGILELISPEERKRQEAIFEILTSEHSYQHSLSILVRHFKKSEELRSTMTTTEHHHLFSNISVIHSISKRFFEDLEKRHTIHPVIQDISDIVQNHATNHFEPYIVYCANETFQQRTLQKLLSSNVAFKEALKRIECSPECGSLPMISFLILPMQRVTRLPLLLDTICQKTPAQTAEYFAACWALKAISKLVKSCNDGARKMERTEQMYSIQKQMDFGKIKPFPLVSSSRWVVKSGELAVCTEELSLFWKAFSHRSYFLFLFNDVLIITKKKGEETFVVLDYATLEHVCVDEEPGSGANPLQLRVVMAQNSTGHKEQIGLVAESKLDKARWVTALREHRRAERDTNRDELPQYEATKAYIPKTPDELGLQQAEVVIVEQEVEGWCHGERMRDAERGWFPSSCASQITSRITMMCNISRMERLRKETIV